MEIVVVLVELGDTAAEAMDHDKGGWRLGWRGWGVVRVDYYGVYVCVGSHRNMDVFVT